MIDELNVASSADEGKHVVLLATQNGAAARDGVIRREQNIATVRWRVIVIDRPPRIQTKSLARSGQSF